MRAATLKGAVAGVLRELALAAVDLADRLDPPAAPERVVLFTTDTTGTWTGVAASNQKFWCGNSTVWKENS